MKHIIHAVTVALIVALPFQSIHADLSKEKKALFGIGLLGLSAIAESQQDKKAQTAADQKINSLDLSAVYSDDDCNAKYSDVLTQDQLESNKQWVNDIRTKIDQQCQQVMSANLERYEAEEAKQRELDRIEQKRLAKKAAEQKAITDRNKRLQEEQEYKDYRQLIDQKRSMATKSALRAWKPIYDTYYDMMFNPYAGLMAKAKTVEEIENAKEFLKAAKLVSQNQAECYHVNMALSYPDAASRDIESLAKSLRTGYKYYKTTTAYDSGMATTSMACSEIPSPPSS
jgi:hypothetical protein